MGDFQTLQRDEPSLVSGAVAAEDHVTIRVIADVEDTIGWWQPNATPFQALMNKFKRTKSCSQVKFDFLEKDELPRKINVATQALAGATTVVVETGDNTKVPTNGVYRNLRTQEHILVTDASSTSLTVVREIGSTASQFEVGDVLYLIGTAYPDNSTSGTAVTTVEEDIYNYTQIFRWPTQVTGRDLKVGLYGGSSLKTLRREAGIEYAKNMELSAFYGMRHTIAASGSTKIRTMTGGLAFYVKSNIWDLDGDPLEENAFIEMLEEGMRWGKGGHQHGSRTKYLFHSSRYATTFSKWGLEKLQMRLDDKHLGMEFSEYRSPHGKVVLVPCHTLDQVAPGEAWLVDLNHITKRYFDGRDTKLKTAIQANDLDGYKEEYIGDCGFQIEQEAAHVRIMGHP